jgi:hypothetical protein
MTMLDLREFMRTGELAGLNHASTRESVRKALGEPDATGVTSRTEKEPLIWLCGGVELHFNKEGRLWLIHFDRPNVPPKGNATLTIEPWIVREGLGHEEFRREASAADIALTDEGSLRVRTSGGVVLTFSEDGLEAVSRSLAASAK